MFKRRDTQESILTSDNQFLDTVGRESFYGFLALHRHEIFRDDDYAFLYCRDNGRACTAPSMLAVALVLQVYDDVADEEAARRAHFDLQWQVALGVEPGAKPFVKSTLQLFRSQLVIHDRAREIFEHSVALAKRSGCLKSGKKIRLALDTTPIFGRGAVKDTYNLLADGIGQLMRVLADLAEVTIESWARDHDFSRYLDKSIKGSVMINWDDKTERETFLRSIVADADRLLLLAAKAREHFQGDSAADKRLHQAAELLSQLLAQDIERKETGPHIKDGVAEDRICSTTDPTMRHGRKSKSERFDGHKAAIAVDTKSQIITAVDLLPANSHDHTGAMDLVRESELNTGCNVAMTLGDCAYGDGAMRKEFQEAERTLIAKAPALPEREGKFSKDDFHVDAPLSEVRCPAGVETTHYTLGATAPSGERYRIFQFPRETCRSCPLAAHCVKHPGKDSRVFSVHPQEHLLRRARKEQQTIRFKKLYRLRQAVEHRIARLVQLGVRQARYCGRAKTLFQLLMTATVANLTLIARQGASHFFFVLRMVLHLVPLVVRTVRTVATAYPSRSACSANYHVNESHSTLITAGCRPSF